MRKIMLGSSSTMRRQTRSPDGSLMGGPWMLSSRKSCTNGLAAWGRAAWLLPLGDRGLVADAARAVHAGDRDGPARLARDGRAERGRARVGTGNGPDGRVAVHGREGRVRPLGHSDAVRGLGGKVGSALASVGRVRSFGL